jgi:hypothetical protein
MIRGLLIVTSAGMLTACNRGSTPAISVPTIPTLTAPQTVYTGTISDSVSGVGTVTVTLGTSGSNAGGTWAAAFPGERASNRFISGTVSGASYTATVSCSSIDDTLVCIPDCRQTFTGTLTSDGLSGSYAEVPGDTCTAHSGTVSATRQ